MRDLTKMNSQLLFFWRIRSQHVDLFIYGKCIAQVDEHMTYRLLNLTSDGDLTYFDVLLFDK